MVRTWLSIRVELVEGQGELLWPRPGRVLAAARSHSFAALATAVDDAFARWDRAHLHQFELADGTRLTTPFEPGDELGLDTFDLGDDWTHLCTVGPERIDPEDVLGQVPDVPLPYEGWGAIPDRYGRRWDTDDGEGPIPDDPRGADLPALRPWWGQRSGAS